MKTKKFLILKLSILSSVIIMLMGIPTFLRYLLRIHLSSNLTDIITSCIDTIQLPHVRQFLIIVEIILFFIFIFYYYKLNDIPLKLSSFEENDQDKPKLIWKTDGFLIVVFICIIYLPTLGMSGLWDPWETHYAEVARRILEQNDWMTIWWEKSWFYSKPILIFWTEAVAISLFGSHIGPGMVDTHIEWAIRFPMVFLSIVAIGCLYLTVKHIWNKQAAVWTSIILATMPFYYSLAHIAMTDMIFVAPLIMAFCMLWLWAVTSPEDKVSTIQLLITKRKKIEFSIKHLIIGSALVVGIPQYFYIITMSKNYSGGVNGQHNLYIESPNIYVPGWIQAIFWAIPFFIVLYAIVKQESCKNLYLYGFSIFAALATLGKGLGGIAIPGLVAFVYVFVNDSWNELKPKEIIKNIVLFFVLAAPWFVAVYFRLGSRFLHGLFVEDQFKRLAVGVAGDRGTIGYFISQLGYGTFPWIAFAPAALVWSLYHSIFKKEKIYLPDRTESLNFVILWFILTFALFSVMMTKFHHYIFPAVPPLAILTGIFLSEIFNSEDLKKNIVWLILGLVFLIIIGRDIFFTPENGYKAYYRFITLFSYNYDHPWPAGRAYQFGYIFRYFTYAFVLTFIFIMIPYFKKRAIYLFSLIVIIFAAWNINYFIIKTSEHWSQRPLMETYFNNRSGEHEKLVIYDTSWKGERFYISCEGVYIRKNESILQWIAMHRGEKHFFFVKPSNLQQLKALLNRYANGAGDRMVKLNPKNIPNLLQIYYTTL